MYYLKWKWTGLFCLFFSSTKIYWKIAFHKYILIILSLSQFLPVPPYSLSIQLYALCLPLKQNKPHTLKKTPQKHKNESLKFYKNTTVFVLCWPTSPGCGASPEVWLVPNETPFFFCQQVSTADSYLVRGGSSCPVVPFNSGGTIWLEPVQALWLFPQSPLSSYVYQSCCVQKILLPWSHPSPLTLNNLSDSSST